MTQLCLATARVLNHLCEDRYAVLTGSGCDDDVAADRIWDALRCATEEVEGHCFDPRDRLFESRLRAEIKKGNK